MKWEIDNIQLNWEPDTEKLERLLEEGWEPYAATTSEYGDTIHLRREIERENPC